MTNQCCHCLMVTSCASITEDRVCVELLVTLAVRASHFVLLVWRLELAFERRTRQAMELREHVKPRQVTS